MPLYRTAAAYARGLHKKVMKNTAQPLLEEYQIGNLKLKNRMVIASLTRGRATNAGLVLLLFLTINI
jgi:N-ethylmaleimide reductase